MNKVYESAAAAIEGLQDGMTVMSGGFGLCGNPENLIQAVYDSKVKDLTVISNTRELTTRFGNPLQARQIKKMISSYVGENKNFASRFEVVNWKLTWFHKEHLQKELELVVQKLFLHPLVLVHK